jgi:glycosyltransferase involved in cell wall biosynthesis
VAVPQRGPLVNELRNMGVQVLMCSGLTSFGNAPKHLIGKLHNIEWIRGVLRWRMAVEAARRICLDVHPDLVHINTMSLFHLSIGVKQAGPILVVQHIREHWFPRRFDPRNRVRQTAFSCIDSVLSITQENGKGFGYPGSTTVVHDWPDFSGRASPLSLGGHCHIPSHKKIFLVPGGRIRIKGTIHAIQAMRHVRDDNAVLLVLGGQGEMDCPPFKRKLIEGLSRLGIRGYSKQVERAAKLMGEKVVLAPSTINMEAELKRSYAVISPFIDPHFSKPVIEAGSLGKPVIASDFPEIREAVEDGVTGMLVPPGDEAALAGAIDFLSNNPMRAACMGKENRRFIDQHYNKEVSLEKIIRIYNGLPRLS